MSLGKSTAALGCAFLFMLPLFSAWTAFAFMTLWNWFAPAALGHLTFWSAYGITTIISLFQRIDVNASAKPETDVAKIRAKIVSAIYTAIGYPAAALLFGWLAHHFGAS